MKLRFYNRNYAGPHFGGSLFSMTDMIYMLVLYYIGKNHRVWDKSADIDFVKPGRGPVYGRLELDQALIECIDSQAVVKHKHVEPLKVAIRNAHGELVAKLNWLIYVGKKPVEITR